MNRKEQIILDPWFDCVPNKDEVWEFAQQINKLNCERILPFLSKHVCNNEIEGFLIHEHSSMSRQFHIISNLLKNASSLQFDIIDCCIIVASQLRSIIENIAVVNFFIHDDNVAKDEKIKELTNFRNQYKDWAIQNDSIAKKVNAFSEFMRQKHKIINKHIWANISPNNSTLSKLIKAINVPDGEYRVTGDMLYNHWDDLSKLIHNNQLFRIIYWQQDKTGIHPNNKMYEDVLNLSLLNTSNIFLRASLHDLVQEINNDELHKIYKEILKEAETEFYNRMIKKSY